METIRSAYDKSVDFSSAVVQWRSSATAPYLMLVNTTFWWSAFYLSEATQLRLLISLAACIFGWDVLLSSSHEHSILMHLISWPIHNTLRTASVAMALWSARSLQNAELESACWLAYGTVGLLMVNPVWQYQRVPQRIGSWTYSACCATNRAASRYVLHPLLICFQTAEYIVLLKWLPVLCSYIMNVFRGIGNAILSAFISLFSFFVALWTSFTGFLTDTWHRFVKILYNIRACVVNFFCAIWCALRDGVRNTFAFLKRCIVGTFRAIKNCIVSTVVAVKNFLVNSVCATGRFIRYIVVTTCTWIRDTTCAVGRWIRDTTFAIGRWIRNTIFAIGRWIKNTVFAIGRWIRDTVFAIGRGIRDTVFAIGRWIRNTAIVIGRSVRNTVFAIGRWIRNSVIAVGIWIRENILEPIGRAACAVGRFLRYWFCAHWWPALKEWMNRRIGVPLQRAFNYFCYGLVYVFCGYWMDPVGKFLARQFHIAYVFSKRQLACFAAFIHRAVLTPVGKWAKARFDESVVWLKMMLHRFVIAVRDSVIWPVCLLLADLLNQLYGYFHATVLQPIFDYFYEKYKMGEDYVFINVLGPACKTIIEHIPEKSPFCDDSDTELAGLLPSDFEEEEEAAENSDTEGTSERVSLPSRPISPLTEDERDFVKGLKFPTIDASESSEGEFNLAAPGPAPRKKRTHTTKAVPKDPMPSVSNSADSSSQRSGVRRQRSRSSLSATSSNLSDSGVSQSSSSSKYFPTVAKEGAMDIAFEDVEKTPSKNPSDDEKRRRQSSMTSGTEMLSGSELTAETASAVEMSMSESPAPLGVPSSSSTETVKSGARSRSRTLSSSSRGAAGASFDVDDQFEILEVKR